VRDLDLEIAKRLFWQYDRDHNGQISSEEVALLLTETYRQIGVEFKPEQEDIEAWLLMADVDKNGKVTLEDFERMLVRALEK